LVHTRASRLDRSAATVLTVANGNEINTIDRMMSGELADTLRQAENLVVFYGSDGLGREATGELALACARLLENSGHAHKVNSGIIPVWERGNTQGLWDNGAVPADDIVDRIARAKVLLIAGADPAIDDPLFERALEKSGFVIVQELFKTATAQKADVVLPVLAFTEREGTYTSGERRVQRFYPAVPAPDGLKADYEIAAELGMKLGLTLESDAASLVFLKMASEISQYNGLDYARLSETTDQWPIIGRADVYYGGTTYDNKQGLGVQLPLLPADDFTIEPRMKIEPLQPDSHELAVYPYTRLLDTGVTVTTSPLLSARLAKADLRINPVTAKKMLLAHDMHVMLPVDGAAYPVRIVLDEKVPEGTALIPRSVGVPIHEPQVAQVVPGRGHND